MLKRTLLLCTLLLFTFQFITASIVNDSINSHSLTKTITTRSFKEFDDILKTNRLKYQPQISEFNQTYITQNFPLENETNDLISKAKAVMDGLERTQNYVDLASPNNLISLPIGIKKEIGNLTYTLGITKARITPEYTEITAFVRIIIPQLDAQNNQKQLFFGANNIKLSHKGGIYGDANLVLLGDVPIPIKGGNSMVVLKGGLNMKTGDIADLTYVTIDCGGFKELGITADVMFPRNMLEPVDLNYKVIPDPKIKVKGRFQTKVKDWNDILADISLPPFQLTKKGSKKGEGIGGLVFELNTAVFDFSDLQNSPNVKFPNDYYQQYLVPGNEQLWRGVYVNTLKVILPRHFKKQNSNLPVVFQASHLLIDGLGVSGNFSVDNVLPLHEGEASKWQFSVDHLEAKFVTNNLISAGFKGHIVLPITEEVTQEEALSKDSTAVKGKALAYQAMIDPVNEDYLLKVTTKDPVSFNVFKAKATLTADSYVELRVSEGKFKPKAVLHGNLAIKGSNSTSNPNNGTVNFKGITFQDMQLQTVSPYFTVKHMGYNGEVKLANFPVTLSDIHVKAQNNVASLNFKVGINLMKNNFGAETGLKIIGNLGENEGLDRWKFKKIGIDEILIKATISKIGFEGTLQLLENDPDYGNGFYGSLTADFAFGTVQATSIFAKKDFRYWYVDALASDLGLGDPGGFHISALAGGASYRMNVNPDNTSSKSASGLSYVPDKNAGLGFRAMVEAAYINPKLIKAMQSYEIIFNRHGGVNRINLYGEAVLLDKFDITDIKGTLKSLLKEVIKSTINSKGKFASAIVDSGASYITDMSFDAVNDIFPSINKTAVFRAENIVELDFSNESLHGEFNTYLNVFGLLRGAGKENRLGSSIIHISPETWYYYAGTPNNRVGTKMGIGSYYVKNDSYFMAGNKLEDSPPPPQEVADILGVKLDQLDYIRDMSTLGSGRGIAFGSSFEVDTGNMSFLVFYARFQAGVGFDVMLRDYGAAECKGSGQIGINGWYANGQAYAYLQGELGIKIKLLFVRKKIPIIKAGAAVLLQAKLPNPAWFRGYVGGHFNLLGGLVKGRFRFKVELGEECEIVGGAPLGGLKIISDVKPDDGAEGIDVFTVPQTVFNMKINAPFDFEDDQGTKTYRILLDEYSITSNGTPIEGDLEWNDNNDVLNFTSFDVLPPNKPIHIKVAVSFQEKKGGSWVTLTQSGKPAKETEEINFTTGDAPDYIPLTNILYSYPVLGQQYFYQKEKNNGYVKLKRGQSYLFKPETNWTQTILFEGESGTKAGSKLSYNKGEKKVIFDFPTFENQKEYTMRILSTPPGQGNTNTIQEDSYTSQDTGQEDTSIEVKNNKAQTVVREGTDVEILVYDFKTSTYNTFADKIKAKQARKHYLEPIYSDVHAIQTDVYASERFGHIELMGGKETEYKPLIAVEAVLDDSYYKNTIYPLIYKGYPLKPQFTVDRDVNKLGLPPKKGIDMLTWYPSYLEDYSSFSLLDTRIPYRYYLPYHYKQDFIDIQYKIVNTYLQQPAQYQSQIQQYNYIINGVFPSIHSGNYKMKMQYILPGGIQGSSAIFNYNNPY